MQTLHEGTLKGFLNKLTDAFKIFVGKAVEALVTTMGSVADTILSFLSKDFGFTAENTWALVALV